MRARPQTDRWCASARARGGVAALLLAPVLLAGCPRDLDVVEGKGEPCEVDADCVDPDTPCGEVLACLDGHCQAPGDEAAMIEVCDGAPQPGPAADAGGDASSLDAGIDSELDAGIDPARDAG